jgi:hypothetical protein
VDSWIVLFQPLENESSVVQRFNFPNTRLDIAKLLDPNPSIKRVTNPNRPSVVSRVIVETIEYHGLLCSLFSAQLLKRKPLFVERS